MTAVLHELREVCGPRLPEVGPFLSCSRKGTRCSLTSAGDGRFYTPCLRSSRFTSSVSHCFTKKTIASKMEARCTIQSGNISCYMFRTCPIVFLLCAERLVLTWDLCSGQGVCHISGFVRVGTFACLLVRNGPSLFLGEVG